MGTDLSEQGLEALIVRALVTKNGYEQGQAADYDAGLALDTGRLLRFLLATQKETLARLGLLGSSAEQRQFFARLAQDLGRRGILRLLREGYRYRAERLFLYYVRPSAGNAEAARLFGANLWSVTRQVRYSAKNPRLAVDLVVFLNGLPLLTMELKNSLTKQDTEDAVRQYRETRDPAEPLFRPRRALVHFAVDDRTVMMCTELAGKASVFLPFNRGDGDGAGNPPNPHGVRTAYLWEDIFAKGELANILENFAQVVEKEDRRTGRKSSQQIFPRYHQLRLVECLLADARREGVGHRYLIQHSAGSGKSNSIAWLAHQLVTLTGRDGRNVFDTVLVVTDRVNLDRQIRDTVRGFLEVGATLGWAASAAELGDLLQQKKKIIITIVHKFQFLLREITEHHARARFAILIDEAHSSQNGSLAAKMNMVLSDEEIAAAGDPEDAVNAALEARLRKRKLLRNASYFAFTATPKNKTLEMFGKKLVAADGKVSFVPHYVYTMRQAIEEHFILDVLQYYTPIASYYRLTKTVADDPRFDKKKAEKLLRVFVEGQPQTIRRKSELIVEHFLASVVGGHKIGGRARAMVVASSIRRAVAYYHAITALLAERHSPYRAILAFSGKFEEDGRERSEADYNGFPSREIEEKFREEPYRLLVVANKFQTGFDEPLLHTMYVDKRLSDVMAVQTLSRLNRCCPGKYDTFVLDFVNDPEIIGQAFSRYYRRTTLAGETDANKLNDLLAAMEQHHVYTEEMVRSFVAKYLADAPREALEPLLDAAAGNFGTLAREAQIEFKSSAKNFVRTYHFLAAILPYGSREWEGLSIFLKFLVLRLPRLTERDLTEGLLEAVDLESYRAEAKEQMAITLEAEAGELSPVPVGTAAGIPQPDMENLSEILRDFHATWGGKGIFGDADDEDVARQIEGVREKVAQDEAYQNAQKYSDAQNARAESDRATELAVRDSIKAGLSLYKAVQQNEEFRQWLLREVFEQTYGTPA